MNAFVRKDPSNNPNLAPRNGQLFAALAGPPLSPNQSEDVSINQQRKRSTREDNDSVVLVDIWVPFQGFDYCTDLQVTKVTYTTSPGRWHT